MPRCELVLPDLGLGEEPVRVSLWLVPRGARMVEGDPLVEVVAGEVVIDLPSPATGTLVRRLAGADEPVHQGEVLGIIEVEEDAADESA